MQDWQIKILELTKNEPYKLNDMTTIEILDALENNEKVSRWTVYRNRAELLDVLVDLGYSEDTQHKVNLLINQANESI